MAVRVGVCLSEVDVDVSCDVHFGGSALVRVPTTPRPVDVLPHPVQPFPPGRTTHRLLEIFRFDLFR